MRFSPEDTLIMLLSAWDRSRDSTAKRNLSKGCNSGFSFSGSPYIFGPRGFKIKTQSLWWNRQQTKKWQEMCQKAKTPLRPLWPITLKKGQKKASFAADSSCRTSGRQNQGALHLHNVRMKLLKESYQFIKTHSRTLREERTKKSTTFYHGLLRFFSMKQLFQQKTILYAHKLQRRWDVYERLLKITDKTRALPSCYFISAILIPSNINSVDILVFSSQPTELP